MRGVPTVHCIPGSGHNGGAAKYRALGTFLGRRSMHLQASLCTWVVTCSCFVLL